MCTVNIPYIKSISSFDKNDGACNGLVTSLTLLVIGSCSAYSRHKLTKRLITFWHQSSVSPSVLSFKNCRLRIK